MNKGFVAIAWIIAVGLSFLLDKAALNLSQTVQLEPLTIVLMITGNMIFMLLVLFLLPIIVFRKKKPSVLLFYSLFISTLAGFLMKLVFQRPRPLHGITIPILNIPDYSFPSLHTFVAFSLAFAAGKYFPRYKWHFYAYAAIVGISRIYLGAHYLSDVVAGAFMGILTSYAVIKWQN